MTAATSSGPSRIVVHLPVPTGRAPAIANCTYAERQKQLLDTLQSSWMAWRDHPWANSYSTVVAAIPGLQSLRLALLDAPATVVFDSTFDGSADSHIEALRGRLGPLFDVVFSGCAGYPGSANPAPFAGWVSQSRPNASVNGATLLSELSFSSGLVQPQPASVGGDAGIFALHALADLHRLAGLYVDEAGRSALWRMAHCLLPAIRHSESGAEEELRAHLAEALEWYAQAPRPAAIESQADATTGVATPGGTMHKISGKDLVMEVLLNLQNSNSVCGYLPRMESSIGRIFLGLDRTDPEYARLSTTVNRAIHSITEEVAFTASLEATRVVVKNLRGAHTWDMKEVSDQVLASLCTLWFDVPDGNWVRSGGSYIPLPPPRCPGSYAPPSGFIFQPEPGTALALVGKIHGKMLRHGVFRMMKDLRDKGAKPRGVLSRAIFDEFPKDDDLVARTVVGVMMGFLPTAQGNLVAVMERWKGARFAQLRQALFADPARDLYERANTVLRDPLVQAMQEGPMPPAVWRTALRDHELGGMQVKAGDRLFVDIDSATHDDLRNGLVDPYPIFGGDRERSVHPTHACPGYWMAMGVMLGIFAALMEAEDTKSPATGSALTSSF